jgi:hypothetical protein
LSPNEIRALEEYLEGRVSKEKKKRRKRRTSTPGQARTAKLRRRASRSRKYRG